MDGRFTCMVPPIVTMPTPFPCPVGKRDGVTILFHYFRTQVGHLIFHKSTAQSPSALLWMGIISQNTWCPCQQLQLAWRRTRGLCTLHAAPAFLRDEIKKVQTDADSLTALNRRFQRFFPSPLLHLPSFPPRSTLYTPTAAGGMDGSPKQAQTLSRPHVRFPVGQPFP